MSDKEKTENKKIIESIKNEIEKIVGMSYDEFEKLDIVEQRKLLKKKKYKYDIRLDIDGVPLEGNFDFYLNEANRAIDKLKYESKMVLKKLLKK